MICSYPISFQPPTAICQIYKGVRLRDGLSPSCATTRSDARAGRDVRRHTGIIIPPLPTGLRCLDRVEAASVNQSAQALDPDHQKLLKCPAYEPMPIDELVDRSGFAASEVASMLPIQELEGCVVSESGLYRRVA